MEIQLARGQQIVPPVPVFCKCQPRNYRGALRPLVHQVYKIIFLQLSDDTFHLHEIVFTHFFCCCHFLERGCLKMTSRLGVGGGGGGGGLEVM